MTQEIDKELDFSNLEPIEIPVPYMGKTYYLREASEDIHKKHRATVMKAYKNVNGEMIAANPDAIADLPASLVGACLFTESGGDPAKRVSPEIIKSMPTRVISKLFIRVRKISGMDQEEITVDSLRKQIAELTKQLEELEAREASGGIPPT